MRSFMLSRGFILPVMVVGIIPLVLGLRTRAWEKWTLASLLLGMPFFCIGLELLRVTTQLFDRNNGSLAPWNPPTEMVVEGPYRYTRNPMIGGIFAMVLGEALALRSRSIGGWLCLFVLAQNIYIRVDEEPKLRERFGAPYEEYERSVPRWFAWGWARQRSRT